MERIDKPRFLICALSSTLASTSAISAGDMICCGIYSCAAGLGLIGVISGVPSSQKDEVVGDKGLKDEPYVGSGSDRTLKIE